MNEIQPIIIIATWSSGSTALAGYLDRCGAHTCPPHQATTDPKTPNAFEPYAYANALRRLFNEANLAEKGEFEDFERFFEIFWKEECDKARERGLHHIVLKHPLQTFILSYLHQRLQPKYLFLTRPTAEIERTRMRRQWASVYGAYGAKNIYSHAMSFLIENSCKYLPVPYNLIIDDKLFRSEVLHFCGLTPDEHMLKSGEKWLINR